MEGMKKKLMRFQEVASNSLLGMALALGNNLKLFDALAEISSEQKPATALAIAEKAGLKERYVKEWLCCVACGGIIEMDETGERFWIAKENLNNLTSLNAFTMLPMLNLFRQFGGMIPQIQEIFKRSGPLGLNFDDYSGIHEFLDVCAHERYEGHYIPDFIPLTGMAERLKEGDVEVLDVGCGTGFHSFLCAKHFPNSSFTAVDLSDRAIKTANNRKENLMLNNVRFLTMDAKELPVEWTKKFDWVMMYNVCHDLTRPDLSLKEIRRVLKDDGVFTMVDINGTSNAYKDKQIDAVCSTMQYAISLFHCLPCGSNSPDAFCLGQKWGQQRAVELLRECGFSSVKITPIAFCEQIILYVCKE